MNKAFGKQQETLRRREAKAQAGVDTRAFYEPDKTGCQEVTEVTELADPDFRLVHRLVWDPDKKLVEYAVVLNRHQGGRWVEVYSADSEHGYLHHHPSGHKKPNDRKNLRPLYTQVDVQESYDEAQAMVMKVYRRMSN